MTQTPIKPGRYSSRRTVDGLEIPPHDWVGLSYTGDDLISVTYKQNGANGTTVATLTLAYSGGKLVAVSKVVS